MFWLDSFIFLLLPPTLFFLIVGGAHTDILLLSFEVHQMLQHQHY